MLPQCVKDLLDLGMTTFSFLFSHDVLAIAFYILQELEFSIIWNMNEFALFIKKRKMHAIFRVGTSCMFCLA